MSSPNLSKDWLGTSGDWGLTKHKHTELCDELEDHLDELAHNEGSEVAERIKQDLSSPEVRRRLGKAHFTDQVFCTLKRLPNKDELRQFGSMVGWLAVILLAQLVVVFTWITYINSLSGPLELPMATATGQFMITFAWLFDAGSFAGLFVFVLLMLVRAYKAGSGVLFARILQLGALLPILHYLTAALYYVLRGERYSHWIVLQPGFSLPAWINALTVLTFGMILGAAVVFLSKKKLWAVGLGICLASLVAYPTGPLPLEVYKTTTPIAYEPDAEGNRQYLVASTEHEHIREIAEKRRPIYVDQSFDVASNTMTLKTYRIVALPFTNARSRTFNLAGTPPDSGYEGRPLSVSEPTGEYVLSSPTFFGYGYGLSFLMLVCLGALSFSIMLSILFPHINGGVASFFLILALVVAAYWVSSPLVLTSIFFPWPITLFVLWRRNRHSNDSRLGTK